MSLVELSNVYKNYGNGTDVTKVLIDLDLSAKEGEMIMIMGPSGCGKTTLLNMLGGIDDTTKGTVNIAGVELTKLNRKELSKFRRDKVGFIFQFYNLIPTLTAIENVELALEGNVSDKKMIVKKAAEYMALVGLADKHDNFPQELSGGEQQRVAVARALAKEPKIILADEPTGNLDEERADSIMKLMRDLKSKLGITFFVVTHNPRLMQFGDRTLELRHGKLDKLET